MVEKDLFRQPLAVPGAWFIKINAFSIYCVLTARVVSDEEAAVSP